MRQQSFQTCINGYFTSKNGILAFQAAAPPQLRETGTGDKKQSISSCLLLDVH